MPTARGGIATAVANGRIYAIEGFPATGGGTNVVEAYDPVADTWSTKASSTIARAYASAVTINGKIYVVGGCVDSDCRIGVSTVVEEYDPVTNTWAIKAPMPTRRFEAVVGVINNKLYVTAGRTDCPPCSPNPTSLEVYDPATNTWTTKAPMPAAQNGPGGVVSGKLYVAGGVNASGTLVNTLRVYDPVTDQWNVATPTASTARIGNGVGNLDGILYSVSGQLASGTILNSVETYNPETDTWSSIASIPSGRYTPQPVGLNGTLYVIGSGSGNSPTTSVEAFSVTGLAGPVGPQGPAGPQGPQGTMGAIGATGPQVRKVSRATLVQPVPQVRKV